MITKKQTYQTSDGVAHESIDAAIEHEVEVLLTKIVPKKDDVFRSGGHERLIKPLTKALLENKESVVDVLTITATSRLGNRRLHRGPRKNKRGAAKTTTASTEPPAVEPAMSTEGAAPTT